MISLYMVLFGLLGFAAECKIRSGPLRKFQFLASRGGRGCAAIFIGSIAMTVGWQFADESDHVYWICVAGMYDVVIGFLLLLSYTCVSTGKVSGDEKDDDYQQLSAGVDNKERVVDF